MLRVQLEERGDLVTMETQPLHRFTDYVTKIKAVFSEETIFDSWHVYNVACDMKFNKAFESMTKKHLSISLMVRYMWVPAKQVWQLLVNNKVNWFLIHFRETRGKFSLRFYKPNLRVPINNTSAKLSTCTLATRGTAALNKWRCCTATYSDELHCSNWFTATLWWNV